MKRNYHEYWSLILVVLLVGMLPGSLMAQTDAWGSTTTAATRSSDIDPATDNVGGNGFPVSALASCCIGRVGDVNGTGGDEPTIGDIVDLAILGGIIEGVTPTFIPCIGEADINQSGGANPTIDDITIGDVSLLINYLFIAGPYGSSLLPCLEGGVR